MCLFLLHVPLYISSEEEEDETLPCQKGNGGTWWPGKALGEGGADSEERPVCTGVIILVVQKGN